MVGFTSYLIVVVGLGVLLANYKGRSLVVWGLIFFLFGWSFAPFVVLALLPNLRRQARLIATAVANATATNYATQNVVVNLTGYAPIAQPQPVASTATQE